MASLNPLSGQIVGGKYQLGELIGEGGFGVVYKAYNLRLQRPQAIKVIGERAFRDLQFRQRFDREAQTLGALNHPNILHVDDYEIEGNRAYLVMPYISGGTFQDILKQQGRLNLKTTGHYLQQISSALDYAHAQGVAHLDLKPLNLLHQNGTLFLSDFGLAHLMQEGAIAGGSSLGFGTPHYMAPEHLKGYPQRASDIYALGIILFEMLTGEVPFGGMNGLVIMNRHINESPPSLSTIRTDIPPVIDTIIQKAMAKQPEDRYPSAGALFNDFWDRVVSSVPSQPLIQHIQDVQRVPTSPLPLSSTTGKHPIHTDLPPLMPNSVHLSNPAPAAPPSQMIPHPQDAQNIPLFASLFHSPSVVGIPSSHANSSPSISRPISTSGNMASKQSLEHHGWLQLDAPPPLDVMNAILQEVGRKSQERTQK